MSSPKLLAYKAIIDHAALLADVVKNPDAIKQAAQEYAAGFELGEVKKAEAEKAFQAIEDAKIKSGILAKDKSEFDEQVKSTLESLSQRKDELDVLKTQCDEKKSSADKIFAAAKKMKDDADILTKQANDKLFDIESREKALAKSSEQLAESVRELEENKAQHKINVANLIARENKLKEALY